MEAQLVVIEGAKRSTISLALPTTIGRSDRAKLKLRSGEVSRTHCELYESRGKLIAKDLGSSNGTLINGIKIRTPTELVSGDSIKIGPVTFQVRIDVVSPTPSDNAASPKSTRPNFRRPIETDVDSAAATEYDQSAADPLEPTIDRFAATRNKDKPTDSDPLEPTTTDQTAPAAELLGADLISGDQPVSSEVEAIQTEAIDADPLEPTPTEANETDAELPMVKYTEDDDGSFVDIQEVGDFLKSLSPKKPDVSDLAIDDLPKSERQNVDSQDSQLQDFFKNFE
ncbi:MAG: FHA domain-containing protein [Pirellulaceae bacterium]